MIFPGGLVRAFARAGTDYFENLKRTGSTAEFAARMLDFQQLNALIGTPQMLDLGRRYEGGEE